MRVTDPKASIWLANLLQTRKWPTQAFQNLCRARCLVAAASDRSDDALMQANLRLRYCPSDITDRGIGSIINNSVRPAACSKNRDSIFTRLHPEMQKSVN